MKIIHSWFDAVAYFPFLKLCTFFLKCDTQTTITMFEAKFEFLNTVKCSNNNNTQGDQLQVYIQVRVLDQGTCDPSENIYMSLPWFSDLNNFY